MDSEVIQLHGPFAEEIRFFFRRDTWTIDEACFILVGVLPVEFSLIGYPKLDGNLLRSIEGEGERLFERSSMYLDLWQSNPNNSDEASPVEFIKWAISKKIKMPWLDYAIKEGLLPACVVDDNQTAPATTMQAESVAQSEDPKPWLIADPKDPVPEQHWYTPARYFARQLVKDDSTLLVKRNMLAQKVADSLKSAGYKKRGNKLPLSYGTVLKALSNVILG